MAGDPQTLVTGSLTLLGSFANLIIAKAPAAAASVSADGKLPIPALIITLFSPRIAVLWLIRMVA